MRTKLLIPLLIGMLVLAMPAMAKELFRAGALSCSSLSPKVTAMSVHGCNGGVDSDKGEMFGACDGNYTSNRVRTAFKVSGTLRETGAMLPDNDKPLAFNYQGMRCQVQSWRVRSVHDCRYFSGGSGMQCNVCILLGGKRCFAARMAVKVGRR